MGFEPGFGGGSVRTGIGQLANDGGSGPSSRSPSTSRGQYTDGSRLAWAMTGEGGYEGLSAVLFVLPVGYRRLGGSRRHRTSPAARAADIGGGIDGVGDRALSGN